MLRTDTGILPNVKIIIFKTENQISFSHWTDEKSGNPEKVGRMASPKLAIKMSPLVVRGGPEEEVDTRVEAGPARLVGE